MPEPVYQRDYNEDQADSSNLCDNQAEQSTLGGMLLNVKAAEEVMDILKASDFHKPAHEIIFNTVEALYVSGHPIDVVTVAADLAKNGDINRVGGAPYLHTLINSVPTAANAGYYAGIVKEKAVLRRMSEVGTRIVQMAKVTDGSDITTIMDRMAGEVAAVMASVSTGQSTALDAVSPDLAPFLDGTYSAPQPTVGHRYDGVPLFYSGEMNRVFGLSEAGKTWLVLKVAVQHLADGHSVVYCDYENGPGGIIPRLSNLGVPSTTLLDPKLFKYLDLRDEALTAERRSAIAATYGEGTMVVFDSVEGVIASNGFSSNSGDDIESALNRALAPLMRAGHALVFIDHETDRTGFSGRSTGTHRKRDMIGGASYRVEKITEFTKCLSGKAESEAGRSRIYVDKDRHGSVRANSVPTKGAWHFGDMVGVSKADGTMVVTVFPPEAISMGLVSGVKQNQKTDNDAVVYQIWTDHLGSGWNKKSALTKILKQLREDDGGESLPSDATAYRVVERLVKDGRLETNSKDANLIRPKSRE